MVQSPISIPILVAALISFAVGCGPRQPTVVVYAALDEMYSRPVLDAFEAETGIRVEAVYDTEAAKTTGLVNRLIAEAKRPRADVFWNNEVAQTIVLKQKGVIVPYVSPAGEAIPDAYKDPDGFWTGLAARGRVIIYNTDLVDEPPTTVDAFLDPAWRGKAAIGKPLFGTTATHAAALFGLWGEEKAKAFFQSLLDNEVAVLAGNATVRDMVADGRYAIGLTDTDDANGAVEDGRPAKWLFPDQGEGQLGTLVIPNSLALIKGAPHTDEAKALIDYLLTPKVEAMLAGMRSIQIPLNPAVELPENVPALDSIRTMSIDFKAVAEAMPVSAVYVREEFVK
ncbi:MAG: extracellular solute-binding protein [bacterium]|nr:extracellular solute-binding protein [bacterium]